MAATDNIIYRLKPEAGDASPANEVGAFEVLTGGTIALVNTGANGYAWRFSGAASNATLPTKTVLPASAGGGVTMAVRMRRLVVPTALSQPMVIWDNGSETAYMNVRNGAVDTLAVTLKALFSASSQANKPGTVATTETETYVFKMVSSATAASDVAKAWWNTTGRVGTTPNGTGTGDTLLQQNLTRIRINTSNSGDYYIHDIVLWSDEKTDAECAALADDLRGTLDGAAGVTATLSTTTDAAVFSGLASVSPLTVLTATLADALFAGSAGSGAVASLAITTDAALFSGAASVAGAVALTLPALKNNTGTVLASETGATVYVYATTGAHVVTKTAQATNASGIMTITDAALVAATQYRVVVVLASGAEGMDKVTAA